MTSNANTSERSITRTREGDKFTNVTLKKDVNGLGFNIRGGVDNPHLNGDTGIFIAKINEKGAAFNNGQLNEGDQIVEVDNINLVDVTQNEAVTALMTTGDIVNLKIISNAESKIYKKLKIIHPKPKQREPGSITITLKRDSHNFGFRIATSGVPEKGIKVSDIIEDSSADKDGRLKVGDQILDINGKALNNSTFEQAMNYLLTTQDDKVVLRVLPAKKQTSPLNFLRDHILEISILGSLLLSGLALYYFRKNKEDSINELLVGSIAASSKTSMPTGVGGRFIESPKSKNDVVSTSKSPNASTVKTIPGVPVGSSAQTKTSQGVTSGNVPSSSKAIKGAIGSNIASQKGNQVVPSGGVPSSKAIKGTTGGGSASPKTSQRAPSGSVPSSKARGGSVASSKVPDGNETTVNGIQSTPGSNVSSSKGITRVPDASSKGSTVYSGGSVASSNSQQPYSSQDSQQIDDSVRTFERKTQDKKNSNGIDVGSLISSKIDKFTKFYKSKKSGKKLKDDNDVSDESNIYSSGGGDDYPDESSTMGDDEYIEPRESWTSQWFSWVESTFKNILDLDVDSEYCCIKK